jgi:hypothetical protein
MDLNGSLAQPVRTVRVFIPRCASRTRRGAASWDSSSCWGLPPDCFLSRLAVFDRAAKKCPVAGKGQSVFGAMPERYSAVVVAGDNCCYVSHLLQPESEVHSWTIWAAIFMTYGAKAIPSRSFGETPIRFREADLRLATIT